MALRVLQPSVKSIGPYELLEKLGAGGMGAVHKARHRRTGEIVALKTIRTDVDACEIDYKRFEREFRVAHALDHPNIVRALDCGMDNGAPYMAMEFVDGESLGDRIERQGRLSEDEAVPIILQVAEALHAAHQKRLIHRDVKPDNILITKKGQAKLTDLGLVKAVDPNGELTQAGSWLGTPNFMAPEQFADAKAVDTRSDIYALGATLFMAVTGEIPFRARSQHFLNILKKKLQNELTAPRSLVPSLSERVDFAIRRAVRADRNQRHPTCRAFIAALTGREEQSATPVRDVRRDKADWPGSDRRVAVRFPCQFETSCQPLERFKGQTWGAEIQDISRTGLRLLARRRFERGTALVVLLHGCEDAFTRTFFVRTVRVQHHSDKTWIIGCEFTRPLSEFELKALV
jgi:serine/threonine protein kinase